jgi:hypothetical protein
MSRKEASPAPDKTDPNTVFLLSASDMNFAPHQPAVPCGTNDSTAADKWLLPKTIEERALGCAAYLIDAFGDSLSFYRNLDTSVIERWMNEDYPDLIGKIKAGGTYDDFRRRLDAYRATLSFAAAMAEFALQGGHSSCVSEYDEHINDEIFGGLFARVPFADIGKLDEESLLTAMLVDRFTHSVGRYRHHQMHRAALHSSVTFREASWGWCDLAKVKATDSDVAYLLPREHFPMEIVHHTRERYALVIKACRAPLWSFASCSHASYINTNVGQCLSFAHEQLAISMHGNESTLLLFRNHLPVLYLFDDDGLLVEYEWDPCADGADYFKSDRHLHRTAMARKHTTLEAFKASRPDGILISAIRAMPLLEGPHIPARFRYDPDRDDSIPF